MSSTTFDSQPGMESVPCPLGCAGPSEFVLEGSDLLHNLAGRFRVLRCRGCGLMRTSPRPSAAAIGAYYPSDYGPYQSTLVASKRAPSLWTDRLREFAKWLFDPKAQSFPRLAPGRLLEVGCASGSFLHTMAQRGWRVEGIEFSAAASEAARRLGYEVATGPLEGIEKAPGQYDLIAAWMVLEHLHDPVGGLQKLGRWSKPGGMLALSVPNAGSFEFKLFGPRWYALQLPTHLFHYDPSTIAKVLRAGGWELMRIQHHRNVGNLIASVGYCVRDKFSRALGDRLIAFPSKSKVGAVLLFPLAVVLAMLGQTGRMTVWARRADAT